MYKFVIAQISHTAPTGWVKTIGRIGYIVLSATVTFIIQSLYLQEQLY